MATAKLPFSAVESDFKAKSRQTYANMKARFSEKRNKKGRIIRIGRELPFDLEQFRAWLLTWLGTEGGVVQCSYCSSWLDIGAIVIDHRIPVNRGGDLGLDNLALCCDSDNSIKGQLTETEYKRLCEFLPTLGPEAEQNVKQRLASAVKLAAQQRWQIVQRAKQAKKRTSPPINPANRLLPNTNDFDEDF